MMVRGGNSSESGSNFMQIRYWGLHSLVMMVIF